MTQTWAIFLEAYRNLNSKKMFWLVLILSVLVVVAVACIGINEKGLKIAFWQLDNNVFNTKQTPPEQFYKMIFTYVGISIWLSWLATILAVISTAGIFPDLLTSGSIDLFVSKPISRLRLFITEYAAGLLFVALQVTVFSAACFLVIGLRGGVWEPGLFLAVPILVCFFSYLFSVSTLLGVVTRSTVAALLLTLLFWFFVWAVGTTESSLLMFKTMHERGVDFASVQAEANANKQKTADKPKTLDTPERPAEAQPADKPKTPDILERPAEAQPADKSKTDAAGDSNGSRALDIAHRIVYGVKTVLPKTTETIALLERSLMKFAKLPQQPQGPQTEKMQAAQLEFVEIIHGRSIAWIVGTSLGFEVVVLFLAAVFFCRRDY
ncbi:MAG: ABC transporter permease subunit [Thermoguttaceae bacterium]|jgi:ABC-type transport system involved in multi-copper enzyme maturation permease subunit